MLPLNTEQKAKVIEKIKELVEHSGSIRVGFAAEKALGIKIETHVKEKIASIVTESGVYSKERSAKSYIDFNIYKTPNYKEPTWIEKNPISFEIIKALITAIFAIGVSVILSLSIFEKKNDDTKEKNKTETRNK